jgi:hypothetical protein
MALDLFDYKKQQGEKLKDIVFDVRIDGFVVHDQLVIDKIKRIRTGKKRICNHHLHLRK